MPFKFEKLNKSNFSKKPELSKIIHDLDTNQMTQTKILNEKGVSSFYFKINNEIIGLFSFELKWAKFNFTIFSYLDTLSVEICFNNNILNFFVSNFEEIPLQKENGFNIKYIISLYIIFIIFYNI